ncbi:PREDICTED: uncharacterized protein LOC104743568 [Camelina sativa]|uniref:Uncharacterized protein LOC104743568 n=1 Tax=Camelina sativa TaxID=90675 RepID=A0ABM0VY79_CAMSA|nr:PREDICTED: uncharacterized protein LOC104743568 [Camelina sativa]
MWYLPVDDRLKRLYQSKRTASAMRWHAEHFTHEGEITHTSDAKAWKHFQSVYGFSPFGMSGRQYSLWPVILTPYNLPPDMCMQSKFLFLSILVLGPKHPKRALDIFLQPLIHELKQLWYEGVQTFDSSRKQNSNMRAVLMWTISDFPAYEMLSGWTTHRRLSCPYCMDGTEAFQLKYGRKPCWFDCHHRFLPLHHPYRRNKKLFRKNKVVRVPSPTYVSGNDLFEQIDYYGAQETCKRGGNYHTPGNMPDGYGSTHNWHKQSIFLGASILERSSLAGKTKNSMKSRLDLAEICARIELHITRDEKLPVPQFRLTADAKRVLFEWVKSEVKFPDGFVSKFSRTLTIDVIEQLRNNIPVLICNLEKIFPPAFFDVMEHLPVHLPHEADLGGPVQFRWMYPFERFMKSLKGNAKNLARVEGSIVAGSLTEETSHFTSYYFCPTVRTKKTRTRRYDDGGVAPTYNVPDVPDIFAQIGRLAGKLKEVWWEDHSYSRAAHNYILRNLDYIQPFERLFEMQIREAYPNLEEVDYEAYKERDFANWLKYYVQNGCGNEPLPLWLHEVVQEPRAKITTAPMYFTRGYTFHTYAHGSRKATANYGIFVQAGDSDFYGVLEQILEVEYPGLLNLRCVHFKCNWYDPSPRGMQVNNWGVVDVNANRSYAKIDPFILASQA